MRHLECSGSESTLKKCGQSGTWVDECNHEEDAGVICSGVRLVGSSRCSGRLEVLHGKTWAAVCDTGFDKQDAEVVCRELGCGPLVEVLGAAAFGRGEGQLWNNELQCRGTEAQIQFCPTSSLKHNCSHYSGVGLVCADSVRLVNGSTRCAGRVEVLHRGQWGAVCDDNWNMKAAAVVCRELGCGEAVDALHQSYFGSGSELIWMDDVSCKGSEFTLKNCGSAGFGVHDCDHEKHAGVICSEVRLTGGSRCSGTVEVLHEMTWVRVCDADFTQQDAQVVCRDLGCGPPVKVLRADTIGNGGKQEGTKEFQCGGSESQIHFCSSSALAANCTHSHYVALVCAEGVKLVQGGSQCAGRVEVFYREQWGTVCDENWNKEAAAVVCKELGCNEAIDAPGDAHFGQGSGPVWSVIEDCSEATIKKCLSAEWGDEYCSHSEDAGVVCSGVRLVGGSRCSGRVEVLHETTWATVCGAGFGQHEAEVVCRELGCGSPVKVVGANAFGSSEGQVWEKTFRCKGTESQIHFCPTSSRNQNCSQSNGVGLVCAAGVRLVDGGSRCAGRVEVRYRGLWGTVCNDNWNTVAATVVCKELGCGKAVDTMADGQFGPGSGPVWMNVYCTGSEASLKDCSSSRGARNICNHGRGPAVICSGHREARLTDGPHLCSGRVEVLSGNTWATVCDAEFDHQDAEVVCRELGCGIPVKVLGASVFGKGNNQVWTKELQCRGNESQIYFCQGPFTLKHDCPNGNDVGLICSGHTDARLVNGLDSCSGRVELKYLSEWGTVCGVNWDLRSASVLCGQLNCGSAVTVLESDWFGTGNGQVWADVFDCQGNETHLSQCPISSWSRAACSHKQDAGVICNGSSLALTEGRMWLSGGGDFNQVHNTIRLVGSGGDCAGRLEVFHKGSWGTVRYDLWDIKDAQVVCRQLQCGVALNDHILSWFGPGTGPIWLNQVECAGKERALWDCRFQFSEENESGHQDDVGVVCSEFKEIRLTEGCKGNLEVFYNGTWGNVCENAIDKETASLICRELNCGGTGIEYLSEARLKSAPNWLDDMKCRKHDATLWHCPSSPWGNHKCDHVAHITCTDVEKHHTSQHHLRSISSACQKPCSRNLPLRLQGGEGGCSGRLELYYNATWGTICSDQWDIKDAQVVCRQLGCGQAVSADGNAAFGAGEGCIWLSRVNCRGNEIHLWDCLYSLKNHKDCLHRQDAGVICAGQNKKTKPTQIPTADILPIPTLGMSVLGALFFISLVFLGVLFYHNRVLRRDPSKRRRTSVSEAMYEEINPRFITVRLTSSPQMGSHITEPEHSGYEHVYEALHSDHKARSDSESYDDTMTPAGLILEDADDTAEDYDDAIPNRLIRNTIKDTLEDYDDVITAEPGVENEDYDDIEELQKD